MMAEFSGVGSLAISRRVMACLLLYRNVGVGGERTGRFVRFGWPALENPSRRAGKMSPVQNNGHDEF